MTISHKAASCLLSIKRIRGIAKSAAFQNLFLQGIAQYAIKQLQTAEDHGEAETKDRSIL